MKDFTERIKEWEGLLQKVIIDNIPHHVKAEGGVFSPPIVNNPKAMIEYFLQGHRPKMIKSLELLNKYVKEKGIILDVGSWISAMGLFFYQKCGMESESISIDCDDWELKGITKNFRKNLCFEKTLGKEKYNLVIEAEMFGHYPGSIIRVLKMMVDACKKNGIIHISVPIGQKGAGVPKDKPVDRLDVNGSYESHFREFFHDEIIEIINKLAPDCELLENETVTVPAFGDIQITIWRNK